MASGTNRLPSSGSEPPLELQEVGDAKDEWRQMRQLWAETLLQVPRISGPLASASGGTQLAGYAGNSTHEENDASSPPPGERTALGHPSTAGRKRSATSEPLPHEGKKRPPKQIWKEEQRKEPFGVVERKMLTYLPYTKKAVDFMQRTRLLKQYQGVSWE